MITMAALEELIQDELIRNERRQAEPTERVRMTIAGARDYARVNIELRRRFLELRGADPTWKDARVPKATNSDVVAVARAWNEAIQKAGAFKKDTSDIPKLQRWIDYQDRLAGLVEGRPRGDVYAENGQFWDREIDRISIWLDSRRVRPGDWELEIEMAGEALAAIPGVVAGAASTVGDVFVAAGSKAGEVAVAPIAGAAKGLGITTTNLLIGAGVIGGLALVLGYSAKKRR